MKKFLLLIFPILIIVSVVLIIFGIFQVRFEEEKLIDDLRRKAKSVAESMDLSVKQILLSSDFKSANYIVEKFERRERLQGCVIYTKNGEVFSITNRFEDWKGENKENLEEVLLNKTVKSQMVKFKDNTLYSYIYPVLDDNSEVMGVIEILHDTSYVFNRLSEIWKHLSITLIILVILIFLIALIIQWKLFVLPVKKLTVWFHSFQKGEVDTYHQLRYQDELGKLASEVEQVALSLRVARKSVTEQAQKRVEKDDNWTDEKLRDITRAKLADNALFVVSNREPYMHMKDDEGHVRCIRPASGVVTALHPILCACGGTWVAHGSGNADIQYVNSKNKLGVPPEDNRYILKRVWLNKEEEEGYYYGFSNEGLWPLCHITHTRPIFKETDWQMYKFVNQKFAEEIIEELPVKTPFVFIQDYHFTLLPKMIKDKRPDAVVALFWHIPWPNSEIFSICPYQEEILEGMLGCDLIGFHVQNHCNNFLDTANRLLESRVDTERFSVVRFGKETFVRSFPISIDNLSAQKEVPQEKEKIENIQEEFNLKGKIILVGVDRIDYTKGIKERILAIDRLLEKYPQYRKKFVFIQLAAPSRTHIKRYHDLIAEIDELVEKKNWKYSDGDWKPVIYLKRHFSAEEITPYYRMADGCIVSSLDDGMNLVAKEYISSNLNQSGFLILSKFTGAARELKDSVIVNPYAIEEFADSIHFALNMDAEEKKRRMLNMQQIIKENNVYRWAGNIITELSAIKKI